MWDLADRFGGGGGGCPVACHRRGGVGTATGARPTVCAAMIRVAAGSGVRMRWGRWRPG